MFYLLSSKESTNQNWNISEILNLFPSLDSLPPNSNSFSLTILLPVTQPNSIPRRFPARRTRSVTRDTARDRYSVIVKRLPEKVAGKVWNREPRNASSNTFQRGVKYSCHLPARGLSIFITYTRGRCYTYQSAAVDQKLWPARLAIRVAMQRCSAHLPRLDCSPTILDNFRATILRGRWLHWMLRSGST